MARYGVNHAAETRKAIVVTASRMLREHGLNGPSVAEIMKSVGLTHGGFYAHFADREALVTAAVEEALSASPDNFRFLRDLADKAGRPERIAEGYLSDRRLADLASGCPAAGFAGELHRASDATRRAFTDGVEKSAVVLGEVVSDEEPLADRGLGALALLVGALVLMRATNDPDQRQRIRTQAVKQFGGLTRIR